MKIGGSRWFTFAEEGNERAEFLIRHPTQDFASRLQIQIYGRTYENRFKKGATIRTGDLQKDIEFGRRWVAAALIDSRNVELPVPTQGDGFVDEVVDLAPLYSALSKELGHEVKGGEFVKMDGHWTPETKGLLIPHVDAALISFVQDCLAEMSEAQAKQATKEGKG